MQNTVLDSRDPQLSIYYLDIILEWINVDVVQLAPLLFSINLFFIISAIIV